MTEEKNIFTLKNVKLTSMGPDTILYIPRAIIKHKVLDPEKRYNIHFEEIPGENQEKKD
ncbi:MAG: hypothetical protein ACFFBC_10840 [Promethearchaeota archaeon]